MKPILDLQRVLNLTIRFKGEPVQLWPDHIVHLERDAQQAVADEKAKWVTAFTAYHKALSEPYFDQDDESRQSNRAEVQRCFDNLKALAEGE